MNFLNSVILFGLIAVLLPFIIHLFTQSKAKPIIFSTLRFLRQLQSQKIRRLKLRQILLLIMRMLIVLLLVLAFARPTCRQNVPSSFDKDAKTSAVLIVDNSISMTRQYQGRSLFEDAKKLAQVVLKNMRAGDEVFLFSSTDTSIQKYKQAFHDFAILHQQIEGMEVDFHKTDLTASIYCAFNILSHCANINKEIYIISDMQASAFHGDSLLSRMMNVRLYAFPVRSQEINNVSIDQIKLRSTILHKGKTNEIEVLLHNRSNTPAKNRLVQVFINDQRVAQNTVDIEPGGETTQIFRFILDRNGFIYGCVQLEDDNLLHDNYRYFTFNVPEKVNLALICPDSSEAKILTMAWQPGLTTTYPFEILHSPPDRLTSQTLDSTNVVVICDVPQLSLQTVNNLKNFIDNGGGLLLILGRSTDIRWYNEILNKQLDLPQFLETLTANGGAFSLGKMDIMHPLFSGIFETEEAHFAKPQYYFAIRTQQRSDMNTILSFSSGDPYLFETRRSQGTILVFTSGVEPRQSDIVYRAIFAPLMHRSVVYLGMRNANQNEDLTIGQNWRFRLPNDMLSTKITIVRPKGEIDQAQPVATASGASIQYASNNQPGIYQLLAQNKQIAQWAVNLDESESDFRPLEDAKLKDIYHFTIIESADELVTILSQHRVGKELWKYLVLAALVLLIIEMLIYREKGEVAINEEQVNYK